MGRKSPAKIGRISYFTHAGQEANMYIYEIKFKKVEW